MDKLKNYSYANIVAMPIFHAKFGRHKILGGFYSKKHPIENGLLVRNYGQIEYPGPYIKPKAVIEEPSIYAGILVRHFGHFLLESLSRMWAIKKHPDRIIVWKSNHNSLNSWQCEILKILGIHNKSIIINSSTLFHDIMIPDPGYVIQKEFHEKHSKELANFHAKKIIPGKKIFLSRTQLTNSGGGTFENETKLEEILKARGWKIFYSEKYSLEEQLDEISSAEVVFGIEGSAFHTLILLSNLQTKFVAISRRVRYNHNYKTIAKRKGISYTQLNPQKIASDSNLDTELIINFLDHTSDFKFMKEIDSEYIIKENSINDSNRNRIIDTSSCNIMNNIYYRLRYFIQRFKYE